MENHTEGLSASHLKELEGVLSSLLTNQEIIMEQNKELLSAKKHAKIWGIVKFILIWIVLPMIAMSYMPQLIEEMMGQINGAVGGQMQNMVQQNANGIDVERAAELMQLLK
jgi:RecA/RadA recombinase